MPLSLPVVIVCGVHAVYAASVIALWLAGGPIPPPQINSLVVASAVVCAVLATRRCGCAAEVESLRARVRMLESRTATRIYVAPVFKEPVEVPVRHQSGIDPGTISALHRVRDRLNGDGG